jgi:hypothetical protein
VVHILDEFTAYSDQLGVSWRSVLEQTNNVGRGPLGVPTNSPISDSGTSARIQNRPSAPIGTAIPKHGDGKLSARLGGNRKQRTAQLPELQMGTRGSAVQRLQRLLNSRLPSEIPLKVDGIFGPKTRAAVIAFQKKAEVKPDGIVGRKTWFSLVLAEHKEPSVKPKPVAAPLASSALGIATTGPAPTPEAAPAATAPPKKRGVDEWSMEERFKYVVTHTLGHLKPEFRAQFATLLTPMNIGIMVGSLVVWAAGHFFGVSEIVDAFLLGFGLVFLGKAAIDAARLLKNVIELTCSASTEAELEDAAKDLAEAIAIIGVVAFFFLLAKVARAIGNKLKAAKAAEKGGSQPESNTEPSQPKRPATGAPPPGNPASKAPLKMVPMQKRYVGENKPNNSVWGTPVKYLSDLERAKFKLEVRDGLLYDSEGKLFDTSDASSVHSGGGRAIFTMDEAGNIYASKYQAVGEFHHSSLAGGEPVAGAGELEVQNGVLTTVTNKSGHYLPPAECSNQVMDSFKSQGARQAI